MASNYKMKGFFKGFKIISQIFAAKEQEMVIGRPTDVKHVAHIGWSSSTPGTLTGNASPSWVTISVRPYTQILVPSACLITFTSQMNVIEGSSDFSSLGYFAPSAGTSWTSQGHVWSFFSDQTYTLGKGVFLVSQLLAKSNFDP
ncbi:hypothetical protein TRIUR3_00422 [Triticum urartu]|uniref:Uncharacterized protein n=2 Tax=Triticinae TaxID=1648030 RepID=M8B2W5_TRIUA|nr:hypothetical protein TRIUR3_00422 [Triticum urartu]